jgi:Ca-activated chloride channel family protein
MSERDRNLQQALAGEPVAPPRAGAKARALARSIAAFDEKYAPGRQGRASGDRLKGIWSAIADMLFGRRSMSMKPALAGGVGLSVLVVAGLAAISYQQSLNSTGPTLPNPTGGSQAPIILTRPAPPAEAARKQQVARLGELLADRDLAVSGTSQQVAAMPQAATRMRDPSAIGVFQETGRDRFAHADPNPTRVAAEEPVSTFSVDVDTASYAFVRAALNRGVLPPADAVRVEELVNYFPYDHARPDDASVPFRASVSVVPSPWAEGRKLVHIGIAGYRLPADTAPHANLVFLIDVSGSMNAPDKLPLLVNSLKLLVDTLKPDDTVAIVTYAGQAGTVLAPTAVSERQKILGALSALTSGGSTAGAEGIRQAYELARAGFDAEGVNRVILATDGDFNVGITDRHELESFIARQRDSGVQLSVLGFGHGNINDALMQTLAQNGNGNAAYIDTLNEARKVLVEEASSTLFTIAGDVKLQVEFNPATVAEYRLIGYETRLLDRADFNNDRVDAGDIGAGHTVTAIYEITPAGDDARLVDDLRYGRPAADTSGAVADPGEYGFLKIRYKLPGEDRSRLISTAIDTGLETPRLADADTETRFAIAVAGFGQLLRGGRNMTGFGHDEVIALALGARGDDPFGYRAEFVNLVRLARTAAALEPLPRR